VSDAPGDDALVAALAAVDRWLTAVHVPYALIGGIAVSLQASPRFTQDIDVLIWADDARWPEWLAAAPAHGIRPRIDDAAAFAAGTRVLLLVHETGVPIDVSCGALPFEREVVASAVRIDAAGLSIPVATPGHLLVLKAIADRPRDHADIESLVRAHPDLDIEAARRVVAEFAQALERVDLIETFDRLTTRS
jgi:hypothetical protein